MTTEQLRKIDRLIDQHVMRHLHYGTLARIGFRPTEDIAAAWEVVEELTAPGEPRTEQFLCTVCCSAVAVGRTFATFERSAYAGELDEFSADADTAPLAISLAALKAVGVDIDKI